MPPLQDYQEFEDWTRQNCIEWKWFLSLGRRVQFVARQDPEKGSSTIKTFSGKTQKELEREDILKIFDRFIRAPQSKKYKSSYYQIQSWKDAPDKIALPAIPAIFRYYEEVN